MKIYQIDAFTSRVFSGNPAAICPLTNWPDDALLQHIAMENNLAETGFYVKRDDHYEIRWFTPAVEVDLCGHATLAAAYVIFHYEKHTGNEVRFHSPRSGLLKVSKEGEMLILDFPADIFRQIDIFPELVSGFHIQPAEAYLGKTDYMLVFRNEAEIRSLDPDMAILSGLKDARGIIVTAPGDEADFVSRFFAPQSGIPEDPVTGSAHTTLTPYWTEKLGKQDLRAIQLSPRKGYLHCRMNGDRVFISGEATVYMVGEIVGL